MQELESKNNEEIIDELIEKFDNTTVENLHMTITEHIAIYNALKELKLYRKLVGPLNIANEIKVNDAATFRQAVIQAAQYLYTGHHEACVFTSPVSVENIITGKKAEIIPSICYTDVTPLP